MAMVSVRGGEQTLVRSTLSTREPQNGPPEQLSRAEEIFPAVVSMGEDSREVSECRQ